MAFAMDGEVLLPASRERVWQALNDPAVLCACLQGCEEMTRDGENGFIAAVKMKVGPVASTFRGRVDLLDLDPPNAYRIEGKGEGGAAGFAKGGARVALSDTDGGTLLRYDVSADIGGRLAQLGGRLINGVAKKQADAFFASFAEQFRSGALDAEPVASTSADRAAISPDAGPASEPVGISSTARAEAAPSIRAATASPGPGTTWVWLLAIAAAILAGFVLGRSDAADWSVVAMIALALVCAGAGYRAGQG